MVGPCIVGVLMIACLLLAPKVIVTARYDAAILRFPFQVDDAEGVLLAEAGLIAEGTDPYAHQPSPAHYFYAGPYTPLYTLLNSGAVATLGPTFKFGRAVQLLATLAVAGWLMWGCDGSRGSARLDCRRVGGGALSHGASCHRLECPCPAGYDGARVQRARGRCLARLARCR